MKVEPVDEHFATCYLTAAELRQCGACQGCCSIMAVPDLSKPSHARCQHQCASGCAIYGKHPETCQSFSCLWKLPGYLLAEADRPDQLGVIFCVRTIDQQKQLEVWELWPAASHRPRVREILGRLTVDHLIVRHWNWTLYV